MDLRFSSLTKNIIDVANFVMKVEQAQWRIVLWSTGRKCDILFPVWVLTISLCKTETLSIQQQDSTLWRKAMLWLCDLLLTTSCSPWCANLPIGRETHASQLCCGVSNWSWNRSLTKHKRDWAHLVKPITRHTCWDNRPWQPHMLH